MVVTLLEMLRHIRKQNPREGTETTVHALAHQSMSPAIRKQNPREGTETQLARLARSTAAFLVIRKQNPREGTETY